MKLFFLVIFGLLGFKGQAQKPSLPNKDSVRAVFQQQKQEAQQRLDSFKVFKADTLKRYGGLASDRVFIKYEAALNKEERQLNSDLRQIYAEEKTLLKSMESAYEMETDRFIKSQDFDVYRRKAIPYKVGGIVTMGVGGLSMLAGMGMATLEPKSGSGTDGKVRTALISGGSLIAIGGALLAVAVVNERKYESRLNAFMKTVQLPQKQSSLQFGLALKL